MKEPEREETRPEDDDDDEEENRHDGRGPAIFAPQDCRQSDARQPDTLAKSDV